MPTESFRVEQGLLPDARHDDVMSKIRTSKRKRAAYNNAIVSDLKSRLTKLEGLQSVCRALGLNVPASVSKCKQVLEGIHINIYDFVDGNYLLHASVRALARYSQANNKVFPLTFARQNPELKVLLRHLNLH